MTLTFRDEYLDTHDLWNLCHNIGHFCAKSPRLRFFHLNALVPLYETDWIEDFGKHFWTDLTSNFNATHQLVEDPNRQYRARVTFNYDLSRRKGEPDATFQQTAAYLAQKAEEFRRGFTANGKVDLTEKDDGGYTLRFPRSP